jgi:quinol monooxygenase YgiN
LTVEVVIIAQYTVRQGEEERVAKALEAMVEPSRAEPGNVDYHVLRDPKRPAAFVLYERYADEAAFLAHQATAHFETWLRGEVLPRLAERTRLDLVPHVPTPSEQ